MRIIVQVKPSAFNDSIEKIDESTFKVAVTEQPVQGRANQAVIKLVAKHFGVKPYKVRIVSGLTSKTKMLEITQ